MIIYIWKRILWTQPHHSEYCADNQSTENFLNTNTQPRILLTQPYYKEYYEHSHTTQIIMNTDHSEYYEHRPQWILW